jgi:hypothetical protein
MSVLITPLQVYSKLCYFISGMRCSKPRKVRNGQIIFKSYRFNATQRAACNAGFRLTGSAVRTCRGNGYWDGKQARCSKLLIVQLKLSIHTTQNISSSSHAVLLHKIVHTV